MAFVDEAQIHVKAGRGGKGCESFYRDKYSRYPKPDGGDGGQGGDVIFTAAQSIQTLLDYRFKQHYRAQDGGHASSKGQKGKEGEDCILRVPIGTILRDRDTDLLIKDLLEQGQSVVVARGGQGGWGNGRHRVPKSPEAGQERNVHLELKIIADVGLIGFPNSGKSTLISAISKVKSKIASYPFTTKQPILGIIEVEDFKFVMADLPGLIEGAHLGRGLGDRFLKHAERTKILIHLIDMAGSEGRDPYDDFKKIQNELKAYSEELFYKTILVVANKMDLLEAEVHLKRFRKKYKSKIFCISALQKTGLEELIKAIKEILCKESFQDQSNASSLK